MVDAGAEKENYFSGSNAQVGDVVRRRVFLHVTEILAGIRIEVGAPRMRMTAPPVADGDLQITDVLVGPI
jgi:hypothetical protein